MVKISSDNSDTEKNITDLCNYLEENGSYIDPNIEILDKGGQTSVFATPDQGSEYIFKLRHELLVPYENFDFDVQGGDIVIAHDDRNKDKRHLNILESMISLYNRSGKFENHLKEHPLLHFDECPKLTECLLGAREGRDVAIVRKIIGKPEYYDELALLIFFKSRLLHCRMNSVDAQPSAVLIPVVEFMNHHAAGAGFDNLYSKKECYLATQAAMPVEGSRECYTSYGRFDALDAYLHYGFVDQSAKYVRSIPLRIDLGDMGTIFIKGANTPVPMGEIPDDLQDMAFYFPAMSLDRRYKTAQLSHIYIPQENARFSMRRILGFIIRQFSPNIDEEAFRLCIGRAESEIVKNNVEYYKTLKLLVAEEGVCGTIGGSVEQLCEVQYQKISHYEKIVNA